MSLPSLETSTVAVSRRRRVLALADALAWPAAWVAAVLMAPVNTGIVGALVVATAAVVAARRLLRAWSDSDRYVFSTAVWAWRAAGVLLFASALVLSSRILSG